ncbi:hypothetical protein [Sulfurovum mangrovi]|uniref:hypothetical protein n=1 Tax=Sulfurovum mangrovi TaxID=2893889 RepID=UPI001E4E9F95|nr:hypothetical protein [Sulfurovum mangrovi]UFH59822.1 hypothetical protein LN246_03015 [Sulfurovum mangrovi]UFH59873.1 hypothetical protein LN246_03275 [Sulfurovum mangrovi]
MQASDIVIAGIFGLNLAVASDAVFIADSTKGIENMDMFISYCEDKKEGIRYAKGTEKLRTLAKQFKELEESGRLTGTKNKADAWTDEIVAKVRDTRIVIKSERSNGRDVGFRHCRGESGLFFDVQQLNALAAVGSTDYVIHAYETGRLKDELMSAYMAKFKKQASYKALGSGSMKVMSLVAASAEKMN